MEKYTKNKKKHLKQVSYFYSKKLFKLTINKYFIQYFIKML